MEPTLFPLDGNSTVMPKEDARRAHDAEAGSETEGTPSKRPLAEVRLAAERAAQRLLTEPHLPAVLLEREWHVLHVSFAFEHLPQYEEVAALSNCHIQTVARPEAGGLEHFLFMTRVRELGYEELMECVDESSTSSVPND